MPKLPDGYPSAVLVRHRHRLGVTLRLRHQFLAMPVAFGLVLALAGSATAGEPLRHPDGPGATLGESSGGVSPKTREGASLQPQTAPGSNGRLVYLRSPVGGWPNRTWLMDADGSDQVLLLEGSSGMGNFEPA